MLDEPRQRVGEVYRGKGGSVIVPLVLSFLKCFTCLTRCLFWLTMPAIQTASAQSMQRMQSPFGGVYLIGLYTLCIRRVVPLIRCDKACFKSLKLKLSSSPLSLPGFPYQRQYHTQNFDLPNVEMERLLRGGGGTSFVLLLLCLAVVPYFSLFYSLLCSKLSHQKFSSKIICEKLLLSISRSTWRAPYSKFNFTRLECVRVLGEGESLNWAAYCGPVTWAW